jgi:predicted nucleic acid-binding Zn ribbon protein
MARLTSKPELVSSVLKKALESLNLETQFRKYSVWEYWNDIVGKRVAEKAEPSHMMGDTLVVKVTSHPWMNELSLMKPILLEKIRKRIEGCPIKNIRFELSHPPLKKLNQHSI